MDDEEHRAQLLRDELIAWNAHCFAALGFAAATAFELAEAGADPHEAERLLKSGCPLALVERIVRP